MVTSDSVTISSTTREFHHHTQFDFSRMKIVVIRITVITVFKTVSEEYKYVSSDPKTWQLVLNSS